MLERGSAATKTGGEAGAGGPRCTEILASAIANPFPAKP